MESRDRMELYIGENLKQFNGLYYDMIDIESISECDVLNSPFIMVDLHGFYCTKTAKKKLEELFKKCTNSVVEIAVIHGYNNGTALRDMVNYELKHRRIINKEISTDNVGMTIINLDSS